MAKIVLAGVRAALIAACAALGVASAQAETLDVGGIYAAGVDLPGDVEVIAIDRLGGEVGAEAEIALLQSLGSAAIGGERFLRVVNTGAPHAMSVAFGDAAQDRFEAQADAVLAGTVRIDAFETRSGFRTRKECVARDREGDCVRREEIRIPCFQATIRLIPRLVLTRVDGVQLYQNNRPVAEVVRYCRDDFFIPSPLDIGGALVDRLARETRLDLAPVQRFERIRVMETRKGLARADRDAFREALALTKRDQNAACAAFGGLEANNSAQIAVLFNIGLCHEAAGDLEGAARYYTDVLAISPGRDYAEQGLARIASRQRAAIQLAARGWR